MARHVRGVDKLAIEVLEALWSYYLVKKHELGSEDPVEALGRIKVMALLVDDVLLRLAKLGETRRDTWNFPQLVKQLPREDPSRVAALKKRVTEYQRKIAAVIAHRNCRIAHVSKLPASQLQPPLEMLSALRMAVSLLDDFAGTRNLYAIDKLDLRASVLGDDAAKQADVVDEAGASDGASQLIPGVRRVDDHQGEAAANNDEESD